MSREAERPYRPCVGVAVFNRAGKLFLGRRKGAAAPYAWQMPQGGIDSGESPEDAAIRELYEETSIRSVRRLDELPRWLDYDLPKSLARRVWNGRYRGQSQRWFAFRFEGEESEIDVEAPGGGRHRPEFDAWRWERLEAVPDLVIPFKREIYRDVLTAFADFGQAAERST